MGGGFAATHYLSGEKTQDRRRPAANGRPLNV